MPPPLVQRLHQVLRQRRTTQPTPEERSRRSASAERSFHRRRRTPQSLCCCGNACAGTSPSAQDKPVERRADRMACRIKVQPDRRHIRRTTRPHGPCHAQASTDMEEDMPLRSTLIFTGTRWAFRRRMCSHVRANAINRRQRRAGLATLPFIPCSPRRIYCVPQELLRRKPLGGTVCLYLGYKLFHAPIMGEFPHSRKGGIPQWR